VVVLDAGADSGDGGDGGVKRKRVFVTSGLFNGDLKTKAGTTTGLAGADKLCRDAATAASLGGTWVAWLSDSTTNAIDRIKDVGPWYRMDGVMVFANKAGLTGNPMVRLNINENGAANSVLFPWSGTNANGTKAATNCTNWTATAGTTGECGFTGSTTNGDWASGATCPCFINYNLYCFEQ
jgi:hypothetical protein